MQAPTAQMSVAADDDCPILTLRRDIRAWLLQRLLDPEPSSRPHLLNYLAFVRDGITDVLFQDAEQARKCMDWLIQQIAALPHDAMVEARSGLMWGQTQNQAAVASMTGTAQTLPNAVSSNDGGSPPPWDQFVARRTIRDFVERLNAERLVFRDLYDEDGAFTERVVAGVGRVGGRIDWYPGFQPQTRVDDGTRRKRSKREQQRAKEFAKSTKPRIIRAKKEKKTEECKTAEDTTEQSLTKQQQSFKDRMFDELRGIDFEDFEQTGDDGFEHLVTGGLQAEDIPEAAYDALRSTRKADEAAHRSIARTSGRGIVKSKPTTTSKILAKVKAKNQAKTLEEMHQVTGIFEGDIDDESDIMDISDGSASMDLDDSDSD